MELRQIEFFYSYIKIEMLLLRVRIYIFFYMLEVYLVTMKQENYKVETEKYIAYEKRLHKDRYS